MSFQEARISSNGTKPHRKTAKKAAPKRVRPRIVIPAPDEVLGPIGSTLTEREIRFAHAFAADPNASKAYRLISPDVTDDTARVEGMRMKRRPEVAELITELRADVLEEYDVTAKRTVEELSYFFLLDPAEAQDAAGAWLPIHLMPPRVRRAIASIEYKDGKLHKLKFVSKEATAGLLMRYHGLLKDKVEHSASESLEALLAQSWNAGGHA